MKKILRYTLRIAGAGVCLLFLFWVFLAIYIEWKKDSLIEKARLEINTRIRGTLQIGHFELSLFRHFPSVTLSLTDVSLRDSAWQRHRHDLLQAGRIYISCSPLRSLLTGRIELGTVFIEHANLYFYTDSTGYSNTYLLKVRGDSASVPVSGLASTPASGLASAPASGSASAPASGSTSAPASRSTSAPASGSNSAPAPRSNSAPPSGSASEGRWPTVVLQDVRWVMNRQDQHKLFDLDVRRLKAVIDREDRALRFDVTTTLTIRNFAFNTEKGSFVRDKPLSGRFGFTYNLASHILQADKARLQVNGYSFMLTGRFFPTVKPDPFFLTVDVERIPFRVATGLLTPRLEQKLDEYDIDKPVSVHVRLDAGAADEREPQIQAWLNLQNGKVVTPTASFSDVSFAGTFTNEWVRGQGHNDENSAIRFTKFSGRLGDIALHSDSLLITNLVHPQLYGGLHSRFDIAALNDLYGSQTLQFRAGTCAADLVYRGPLSENDTAGTTVNGFLDLDSAAIDYLPFQFLLTNASGRLLFRDQDLVVDRLRARAGNTNFQIKGIAKNLISLIDHNAEDVNMDCTLSTGRLALEDFVALVGRVSTASARRKAAPPVLGAVAERIDHFLKTGVIRLRVDAANISYHDFAGAHARADVMFRDGEIRVSQLAVEQSSGTLGLRATLLRQGNANGNPWTLESHLEGIDLPELFRSFDDFGQNGIGARNLKGKMNAEINLTGLLTDRARIVPNSLKGTVDFSIVDGRLTDWEPMDKIHEAVLKKRDLSEVLFAPLRNSLAIDSTTITLHRMEIQSTAFTLYAEGTYDFKKGTDMSLQIPVSNLKARSGDVPPESRGNDSKGGLSLHLRARTGDDGKLKISWDPFRKGPKKGKKA